MSAKSSVPLQQDHLVPLTCPPRGHVISQHARLLPERVLEGVADSPERLAEIGHSLHSQEIPDVALLSGLPGIRPSGEQLGVAPDRFRPRRRHSNELGMALVNQHVPLESRGRQRGYEQHQ